MYDHNICLDYNDYALPFLLFIFTNLNAFANTENISVLLAEDILLINNLWTQSQQTLWIEIFITAAKIIIITKTIKITIVKKKKKKKVVQLFNNGKFNNTWNKVNRKKQRY